MLKEKICIGSGSAFWTSILQIARLKIVKDSARLAAVEK